jgi:hypothetical protein
VFLSLHPASSKGRIAIVTDVEAGSGGRIELQRDLVAPTNGSICTAKWCGPGIPVLMPVQCAQRALSHTGAIKPVPGESAYKS